ncbi:metal-dependent hydrolase [Thiohalocapsa halophila]|uniref:Metal-dependent hydrolase n=1 Tax=Thiohalocapsa halophila TaxID=69359 RepID=A0ABS1CHR5_9GAMM|nr:MBL fold metallo-hydrolase [Thiohalocapsa halophila]MBK1631029.1 metal-dependent hydrolase [Thiohalocapsa halophila]
MSNSPRLTILFDNVPGLPGLESLWGFAALIETGEQTVLFDTGSNGRALLRNMAALGLDPTAVDVLFLSHPHWDHIGGLDSVLECSPALTLVLHQGFSKHLIADLRGQCKDLVVVGAEPRQLAPGLLSTGMLSARSTQQGPPEQGLVLDTTLPDGAQISAVVSGCAHPGMERLVERGTAMLARPIDWAIGGFHLMYAGASEIAHCVGALQALDVAYVAPTHCTGDAARAAFRQAYGEHCAEGGAGREILLRPRFG